MDQAATLTTGWEPDTPLDHSILPQFVFTYADRVAWMARATGGRVDRLGPYEALAAGPLSVDELAGLRQGRCSLGHRQPPPSRPCLSRVQERRDTDEA